MNKYDIALAGLLHDIGKFFEKANSKGGQVAGIEVSTIHHGITSANFIEHFREKLAQSGFEVDAIKEMVQRHHEYKDGGPASVEDAPIKYRPYCYLIDKADNLSSSERLNTRAADGSWQLRQLTNVFSLVAGKKYSQEAGVYGEVYNRVTSGTSLNSQSTNHTMVEKFVKDFDSLEIGNLSNNDDKQRSFISKVDSLLKKYTWCYPSDTREYIRDISLYSHLQTTGLLSSVLYSDLTTDPSYKKGLTTDKQSLGWKFTEVSIKELRTQSITIMQINLANALNLITSSTLSDAQALKSYIIKLRSQLEDRIINQAGLSSINIICRTTTGFIVIVNNTQVSEIIELIHSTNSSIAQPLGGLALFFEVAYSKLEIAELANNNTGKVISNIAKTLHNQYSDTKAEVTYIGLNSLLVNAKSNTWGNFEIASVTSVNEIVSKTKLTNKQSELKDKLNSKALSLVKIRIDNYDELVTDIMNKSFGDLQCYLEANSESNSSEKHIGTLCRLSTILDQITRVVGLNMADSIYLSASTDGIVAITSIDRAMKIGSIHRKVISKQTAGTIKTSLFIETISGKNLESAFKQIEVYEQTYKPNNSDTSEGMTNGVIVYNGTLVDTELFSKMPEMLNMLIESAVLKSGKSNLYKFLEYTNMYKQYCETGDTSYLLFIPRFQHTSIRNFNKDSITDGLKSYMDSKIGKLSRANTVTKNDTELLVLSSLIYDALQMLRISGEE